MALGSLGVSGLSTSDSFTQLTLLVVTKSKHLSAHQAMWIYQSRKANDFKRDYATLNQLSSNEIRLPLSECDNLQFKLPQFIKGADKSAGEFWRSKSSVLGKLLLLRNKNMFYSSTHTHTDTHIHTHPLTCT